MQIAQIAPLTEAIPPKLYGGTERVISWLADELVALGHDVVLFAIDGGTGHQAFFRISTALVASSSESTAT